MPSKPLVFVLLGRGGSGKTETSRFVSAQTKLPVIELGNIIRERIDAGSTHALGVFTDFIKPGRYFPAGESLYYIERLLLNDPKTYSKGFIIDGFPRSIEAAQTFENFLNDRGFKLGGVLEFRIPKGISNRRQLQRKREPAEAIQKRQAEFEIYEAPAINWYRKRGLVKTVISTPIRKKQPPAKTPDLEFTPFLRHHARQATRMIQSWRGLTSKKGRRKVAMRSK